jgi:hypothetical protein
MGMRRHRLRDQHSRYEDQHPEQWGVPDLLEEEFHGGRRLHIGCDGVKSGLAAGPVLIWVNTNPQAGRACSRFSPSPQKMSALGQTRYFGCSQITSDLHRGTDIVIAGRHVSKLLARRYSRDRLPNKAIREGK